MGNSQKKTIYNGGIAKKGGLGLFADIGGGLAKTRGWCFFFGGGG